MNEDKSNQRHEVFFDAYDLVPLILNMNIVSVRLLVRHDYRLDFMTHWDQIQEIHRNKHMGIMSNSKPLTRDSTFLYLATEDMFKPRAVCCVVFQ